MADMKTARWWPWDLPSGGQRGRLHPEASLGDLLAVPYRVPCPIPPLAAGERNRPLMTMCGRPLLRVMRVIRSCR
ncbi:MAG: hypothetical protein QOE58_3539 [Actinomycetota bacterium]|nr:hypothetical protein [Actinomycetota bacterium]